MPTELIGPFFLFLGVIVTAVVGRTGQRGQQLQERVKNLEESRRDDEREKRILLDYVYDLRGDLSQAVDAAGQRIPVREWPEELTKR